MKINRPVLVLSLLLSILMYPKTIEYLAVSARNIYIANKLSASITKYEDLKVDSEKIKIVFMFDDGWKSVYTDAYQVLEEYDFRASVPIIPSLIEEKEYMQYEELAALYMEGWDLLNHSYSHEEDSYDNPVNLISDFNTARQSMNNRLLEKSSDMVVMPYGEVNPYLLMQLKEEGYRNLRTSDNIIILDKDEVEYLSVYTINLLTDMSVDQVKVSLTKVYNNTNTIIIILHKISNIVDGYGMNYRRDKFEAIVKFIHDNNDKFQVITYSQLF